VDVAWQSEIGLVACSFRTGPGVFKTLQISEESLALLVLQIEKFNMALLFLSAKGKPLNSMSTTMCQKQLQKGAG
jgi:hypothetical protein